MFGTLVSPGYYDAPLEFANTDPAAAVNRNPGSKTRVSCMLCRSKKVRCSGQGSKCQRCVDLGRECVWPESPRRRKGQLRSTKDRQGTTECDGDIFAMGSSTDREICPREDAHIGLGEGLSSNHLDTSSFGDGCINDGLLTPWTTDTPLHQTPSDSGLSVRSSTFDLELPTFEPAASELSFSAPSPDIKLDTVSDQFPTVSGLSDSVLRSAWNEAGLMESWNFQTTDTKPWSPSTSAPVSDRNPCCLLGLISLLERLISVSEAYEARIGPLLTDVRTSLEGVATFMSCKRCASHTVHSMLLAMVARQIGILCNKAARCCKDSPEIDHLGVSIPSYRLTGQESLHILKSLVALHVVTLRRHVDAVKSQNIIWQDEGQVKALEEAEHYILSAQEAIDSTL